MPGGVAGLINNIPYTLYNILIKITPIILSGGAGTRLWHLSWGDHPKQFLPLVTEHTMIQETLLRLKGLDIGSFLNNPLKKQELKMIIHGLTGLALNKSRATLLTTPLWKKPKKA